MNHLASQQYLSDDMRPPTEPQPIPEIDRALDAWLEAKHEQKNAAETTKIKHASLLAAISEAGLEAYPYVDRTTGKKRLVYPDKTPRLKTTGAERSRHRDEPGEEVERADRSQVFGEAADDKVEMRRISRASVAVEIDPFAATRDAMTATAGGSVAIVPGLIDDAEAWQRGEDPPGTPAPPAPQKSKATKRKAKR